MNYTIGARASRLSMAQTEWVIKQLKEDSAHDFTIKKIITSGDTDSRPLFAIDQKGIFAKEIDRAVLDGSVDFAVHSLKDVPSQLPAGLVLASVPKREMINDVFISKNGDDMDSIASGSIVGTSSLRRAVQVMARRTDLQTRPIRGNIETRIAKSQSGDFDAIVLAGAGILRLGLDVKHHVMNADDFIPSPGQGALAIICRSDDQKMISILNVIEDPASRLEVESERALSDAVDSGCRFPVGAYAKIQGDTLTLQVSAFSIDGKKSIIVKRSGPKSAAVAIGRQAGEELQEKGVKELALNWRKAVEEWNRK